MSEIKIGLSGPDITEAEIQAVCDVLRSGQLSLGPKLAEFEDAVAKYTGAKYAVAVNSGTSALFLCLKAMEIGPGDEVITTPFTFIATINVILQVGAKPVLVDIDEREMNINPSLICEKITNKTKAIEPVLAFGNPWGLDEVCRIAKENNLLVIEDSCEALGTFYHGKSAGRFGDAGFFGFYPNKQITTGEGGMMITDDKALADMCVSLRNQGRGVNSGWLGHTRMGYNFRLPDINCAIGIVQLSRIEQFKAKRKRVANKYINELKDEKQITLPKVPADCDLNWFVFIVKLSEEYSLEKRNTLLKLMREAGIGVSNYFPPAHLQPYMVEEFGYKRGDFPITESVSDRTVALPFHNNLTDQEIEIVCETIKECISRL